MNTLYIVMPAYNEEDNIETVIRQWIPILEGKSANSKMVIADSGSTDKTHEILLLACKGNIRNYRSYLIQESSMVLSL